MRALTQNKNDCIVKDLKNYEKNNIFMYIRQLFLYFKLDFKDRFQLIPLEILPKIIFPMKIQIYINFWNYWLFMSALNPNPMTENNFRN